jgi:aldose sugar dehydrogenase
VKRIALAVAAALILPLLLPPSLASAAVRRVRVIACPGGDCWPAAFAFTPNGQRIFYARRFTGEIRVFDLRTKRDRRYHRIRGVATSGEQGLLGLAVDPGWPRQRFVYAYYTNTNPLQNRIVRIRKQGGSTRVKRLATIPAANFHNAGVIHFGPDGKLWAVTGDAGNRALSQRRRSPAGKVLRMNRNGSRPKNNPFAKSKAWSFGHRNSFGFAFDPRTGRPWQTENGPECDDEINRILKGRNYGWGPNSSCPGTSTEGPNPVRPRHLFNPVVAPTGAAFCQRCRLGGAVNGNLLVGAWNTNRIYRLVLNDRRTGVVRRQVLFANPRGVVAVEAAPDGRIYFSDPGGIYRLRRT